MHADRLTTTKTQFDNNLNDFHSFDKASILTKSFLALSKLIDTSSSELLGVSVVDALAPIILNIFCSN